MKKIFALLVIALLVQFVGCKVAQEQVPTIDHRAFTLEKDELSESIKTLYNYGAYFTPHKERPQRIRNDASKIDMYKMDEELGEFGVSADSLQVEGGKTIEGWVVMWLYDGEKNFRLGVDESYRLLYEEIIPQKITPYEQLPFSAFIPSKELSLYSGLTLEDSIASSEYPNENFSKNKDKHLVIFVWNDRKLDYAFIVR